MNDLAALLPLVAILALFWFMVIRPQQRRQREVTAAFVAAGAFLLAGAAGFGLLGAPRLP